MIGRGLEEGGRRLERREESVGREERVGREWIVRMERGGEEKKIEREQHGGRIYMEDIR